MRTGWQGPASFFVLGPAQNSEAPITPTTKRRAQQVEIKGGKEQLGPNLCLLYPKSEQVLLEEKKREGSLFSLFEGCKNVFLPPPHFFSRESRTRLLLMVLIIADLGPGQTQLDGGGHLFPFFSFCPWPSLLGRQL